MLIGIFSDIHDHMVNLEKCISYFESQKITIALFCGDFCSPIPVKRLIKSDLEIHAVWGNTEDRYSNTKLCVGSTMTLHGEHAELVLADKKIALTHYPLYARALARTGDYDAVFFGHKHQVIQEQYGDCLCVNPGEVMGQFGQPSCAIYDTTVHAVEIILL